MIIGHEKWKWLSFDYNRSSRQRYPRQSLIYRVWVVSDINEFVTKRSILALINGQPWDMHRPLEEDCELEFLHMLDEECELQNKVSNTEIDKMGIWW